jgi:hypothetical protein
MRDYLSGSWLIWRYKFTTATLGSDGLGSHYWLSSLWRLKITLGVQGIESLLRCWITSVTWKHFFGWCSPRRLEVISVARGHFSSMRSSGVVESHMRLRVTLTLRKGLSPRTYFYRSIHFYRTKFVMYCFDWKYWLYMSGYKHPYKRTNVQMDRST